jgi:hypothetical protein
VNFTSDDTHDRVQTAYTEEQSRRLVQLKSKYDPMYFFCLNSSIPRMRDRGTAP